MAYATLDDLLQYAAHDELVDLTVMEGDGVVPDADLIDAMLDDSSAELDSYLPPGVSVPEGHAMAKRIVCLLTLFHLYSRGARSVPNEARTRQFDEANQWLFLLSMGSVNFNV